VHGRGGRELVHVQPARRGEVHGAAQDQRGLGGLRRQFAKRAAAQGGGRTPGELRRFDDHAVAQHPLFHVPPVARQVGDDAPGHRIADLDIVAPCAEAASRLGDRQGRHLQHVGALAQRVHVAVDGRRVECERQAAEAGQTRARHRALAPRIADRLAVGPGDPAVGEEDGDREVVEIVLDLGHGAAFVGPDANRAAEAPAHSAATASGRSAGSP